MIVRQTCALPSLLLAFLAGTAGPMNAQQATPPQERPRTGPRNPLTRPEHFRLAFLAGQWEEEIRFAGNEGEAGQGKGRWTARPALGLYLVLNYESQGPQGAYRAIGLLTYDREAQNYRMWWFDDAGGIGEYRGNWADENSLVLEHSGKVEGRAFRERISYTRVSQNEVRTKIEQAWDSDDYRPYLEADAHRTEPSGPSNPPRQNQRPPQ